VVALLAASLAGMRDDLGRGGFRDAAELVAELVEAADDFLAVERPDKRVGS
jgi:hypothetical protein